MKILMIVAQENYRDEEYDVPKKAFESAGHEVITASKKIGVCKGKLGSSTNATISIDEVNAIDYAAVVFIGGGGSSQFQHDIQAHLCAQEAHEAGKVVAAICIAPSILAHAGVLEGKKATIHNKNGDMSKYLEKNDAIFVDEPVVVDGKIVTANGPDTSQEFAEKIIELL